MVQSATIDVFAWPAAPPTKKRKLSAPGVKTESKGGRNWRTTYFDEEGGICGVDFDLVARLGPERPGMQSCWQAAINLYEAGVQGDAELHLQGWQRERDSCLRLHKAALEAARTPFFKWLLEQLDDRNFDALKQERGWASTATAAGWSSAASQAPMAK